MKGNGALEITRQVPNQAPAAIFHYCYRVMDAFAVRARAVVCAPPDEASQSNNPVVPKDGQCVGCEVCQHGEQAGAIAKHLESWRLEGLATRLGG